MSYRHLDCAVYMCNNSGKSVPGIYLVQSEKFPHSFVTGFQFLTNQGKG